ncbi:unnamed protein product, partial [Rotaria sp. Silwood2]
MMWSAIIFYLVGLSTIYCMNIDLNAVEKIDSTVMSEKNLSSFSNMDQNLKYFIANRLQSISNSLNHGKIIPSFSVQPNEGERLQVLAVANSERIIKIRGSQTDGRIM